MEYQVFNPSKMDPAISTNPAFMQEIMNSFRQILMEELDRSTVAIETNDVVNLGFSMHKIAPNFMFLALDHGYATAKKIELMARQNQPIHEIAPVYTAFQNWCNDLLPEIDHYLNQN